MAAAKTQQRSGVAPPERWKNSITHYGEAAPDQLLPFPLNPKIHPKTQQTALAAAIGELGWLMPVVVNSQTGHLLDGHARVGLAISRNEPSVPVAYVSIPPEQEALAVATIDPIGSLAATDKDALDGLLREIATGDAALQEFLAGFAVAEGLAPPAEPPPETYQERFELVVECDSEQAVQELYERMKGEGYRCRTLIL